MPEPAYMPMYWGDYDDDTADLSLIEHGAYLKLMRAYWQRQRPLPDHDEKLMRLIRATPDEWQTVKPTVQEFFSIKGGLWHHKRLDREIASFKDKSEKARAAVEKRWSKQSARKPQKRRSAGEPSSVDTDVSTSEVTDAEAEQQRTQCHTDTDTDIDSSLRSESLPVRKERSEERDSIRFAVEMWNGMAETTGRPKVQKLTDTRRAKLKQRLKDCGGLEGWKTALSKIPGNPFLLGQVGREGWNGIDFDFLLRQDRFTKLMEGGYDRDTSTEDGKGDAYRSDTVESTTSIFANLISEAAEKESNFR